MVQIVINIEKRHLWVFAILIVLFAGVGYVVGFGTSDPQTFGHTSSEIQGGTAANPLYGVMHGSVDIISNELTDAGTGLGINTGDFAVMSIWNTQSPIGGWSVFSGGDFFVAPSCYEGYEGGNTESCGNVVLKVGRYKFTSIGDGEAGAGRLCVTRGATGVVGYFEPGAGFVPGPCS